MRLEGTFSFACLRGPGADERLCRARNKGKVMSASDEGGESGEGEGDEMGD